MISRFTAGSVDVCKGDDKLSFHFSTQQGVVVATVDLKEFVLKCRGKRDHNLNTLPTVEDYAPKPEDLPLPARATFTRKRRGLDADMEKRFQLALAGYIKGDFTTKSRAANFYQIGHVYQSFVNWSRRQSLEKPDAPQTDGDRPLVRKPGGKLL